jgi:hypothetical protein
MWMGIADGWLAMCCPSRMPYADLSDERFCGEDITQIGKLSRSAPASKFPVFQSGNSRAVIAAIFEPCQGFYQSRRDSVLTQYSNYTTHILAPIRTCLPQGRHSH